MFDERIPKSMAIFAWSKSRSDTIGRMMSSVELFGEKQGVVLSAFRNRKLSLLELCIDPPAPRGCAAAYRRCLRDNFTEINRDCIAEDMAYSFRAGLLGVSGSIPDVLVKYRVSQASLSLGGSLPADKARKLNIKTSGFRQNIKDYDYVYKSPNYIQKACRLILVFRMNMHIKENSGSVYERISAWMGASALLLSAKLIRFINIKDWCKRKKLVRRSLCEC